MTVDARTSLAAWIDICQYDCMPKTLPVVPLSDEVACCPPLARAPLSEEVAAQLAPMFKALGDPVRLRLLSLIAASGDEACVCDLTDEFELGQPTISHHLRILREAGMVTSERRGTWVYYRLHPDVLPRLGALLEA